MATKPAALTWDQFVLGLHKLDPTFAYRKINNTDYEWRSAGSPPSDSAITTAYNQVQTTIDSASTEANQIKAALTALQTFRDNASPTNPEVVAQVKLQARILQELIRRIT